MIKSCLQKSEMHNSHVYKKLGPKTVFGPYLMSLISKTTSHDYQLKEGVQGYIFTLLMFLKSLWLLRYLDKTEKVRRPFSHYVCGRSPRFFRITSEHG